MKLNSDETIVVAATQLNALYDWLTNHAFLPAGSPDRKKLHHVRQLVEAAGFLLQDICNGIGRDAGKEAGSD